MERDQASKFMFDLLRLMVSKKGSDLFITSGFPPEYNLIIKAVIIACYIAVFSEHFFLLYAFICIIHFLLMRFARNHQQCEN